MWLWALRLARKPQQLLDKTKAEINLTIHLRLTKELAVARTQCQAAVIMASSSVSAASCLLRWHPQLPLFRRSASFGSTSPNLSEDRLRFRVAPFDSPWGFAGSDLLANLLSLTWFYQMYSTQPIGSNFLGSKLCTQYQPRYQQLMNSL